MPRLRRPMTDYSWKARLRRAAGRAWSRRWIRICSLVAVIGMAWVTMATPAFAATDDPAPTSWLPGMNLKDTRGIPINAFNLDIDQGGVTHPMKFIVAVLLLLPWFLYRMTVAALLTATQFMLSMKWVDWIATPVVKLAGNIEDLLGQLHWLPLFGAIVAIVVAIQFVAGRVSSGLGEMFMALVIAALTTGMLANPVGVLTGPHGAITGAENMGAKLAVLTLDPDASTDNAAEQVEKVVIAPMIDVFIREPNQIINYGKAVDYDGNCGKIYDAALKGKIKANPDPFSPGISPREAMKTCDSALGAWADDPGFAGLASGAVLQMGALALVLFLAAILGVLAWSIFALLWEGIKLMVSMPFAMLHKDLRANMWSGIGKMGMDLVFVVLSVTFLGAFMKFVSWVLGHASASQLFVHYMILDLLLICGAIAFLVLRHKLKKRAETIGGLLHRATGGGAYQPVQHNGFGSAVRTASHLRNLAGQFGRSPAPATGGPAAGSPVATPHQAPMTLSRPRPRPEDPPSASPSHAPTKPSSPTPAGRTASVGDGSSKTAALTSGAGSPDKSKSASKRVGAAAGKTIDAAGTVLSVIPATAPAGKAVKTVRTVGRTAGSASRSLKAAKNPSQSSAVLHQRLAAEPRPASRSPRSLDSNSLHNVIIRPESVTTRPRSHEADVLRERLNHQYAAGKQRTLA